MCSQPSGAETQKPKAIVLLSGGLDSTVSLAIALELYDVVKVLTFHYGQRAADMEIQASTAICQHYGLPHQVINLPWMVGLLPDSLQASSAEEGSVWVEGDNEDETFFEAKPVWVPNRNGVFLNIAASFAEKHEALAIVFGANAEEGERFPDNTDAFREACNRVFELSTLSKPKVICPVGHLNKSQMLLEVEKRTIPLHLMWSCYGSGPQQCGVCPSCYRLKQALEQSGKTSWLNERVVFAALS